MSFFFTCCSENIENDNFTQDMTIETKVSGKDRILRLNQQENFQEYTKYFQVTSIQRCQYDFKGIVFFTLSS